MHKKLILVKEKLKIGCNKMLKTAVPINQTILFISIQVSLGIDIFFFICKVGRARFFVKHYISANVFVPISSNTLSNQKP